MKVEIVTRTPEMLTRLTVREAFDKFLLAPLDVFTDRDGDVFLLVADGTQAIMLPEKPDQGYVGCPFNTENITFAARIGALVVTP